METSEFSSNVDTSLLEIAWLSSQSRSQEFHSLMHHINVESLRICYNLLDGKKAVGVDGMSKEVYGQNLQENLETLIAKMKRMGYRPQSVREVRIPKEGQPGSTRPLGICNFEDKLVQKRMQELLESIYDPIFVDWSYGFRPGKGVHDAIKALSAHLYAQDSEAVLDVDIQNFFGSLNHQVLKGFLAEKIKDTKFLRYITRMLNAGVLTEGELIISEEGVPQGSCCSPVLANIYAHYVIDVWLEEIKPLLDGRLQALSLCG
ncbi:reverse transcriptase domain-containing protein [Cardinium endosymbiont of Culicoides punctatus]|uniref:reverse transcriptase domain-containing protein n=1 Tax=Cardinium endosymbiont of Culicoides punctatus TaxID=2304601 RepID=UPI001058726A|nr:reverse transcriptase domain-containing protein [Cardinium endosymbiont of Culicoides punctatus]